MAETSIIGAVRDYIDTCPFLDEFAKIDVEYLSNEKDSYTVDALPGEPLVQRYLNGDSEKQFSFTFSSRKSYGPDVLQNLENSGFYERFADWLESESRNGNLPKLPEGKEAMSIRAISQGFVFQTDYDEAQYQIQCRVLYYQKGAEQWQ